MDSGQRIADRKLVEILTVPSPGGCAATLSLWGEGFETLRDASQLAEERAAIHAGIGCFGITRRAMASVALRHSRRRRSLFPR